MTKLDRFIIVTFILMFITQGVLWLFSADTSQRVNFESERRLDKFDKKQTEKFQTLNDELEEIHRSLGSLNDYTGLTVTEEPLGFENIPIYEDTFPIFEPVEPIVEIREPVCLRYEWFFNNRICVEWE